MLEMIVFSYYGSLDIIIVGECFMELFHLTVILKHVPGSQLSFPWYFWLETIQCYQKWKPVSYFWKFSFQHT